MNVLYHSSIITLDDDDSCRKVELFKELKKMNVCVLTYEKQSELGWIICQLDNPKYKSAFIRFCKINNYQYHKVKSVFLTYKIRERIMEDTV